MKLQIRAQVRVSKSLVQRASLIFTSAYICCLVAFFTTNAIAKSTGTCRAVARIFFSQGLMSYWKIGIAEFCRRNSKPSLHPAWKKISKGVQNPKPPSGCVPSYTIDLTLAEQPLRAGEFCYFPEV